MNDEQRVGGTGRRRESPRRIADAADEEAGGAHPEKDRRQRVAGDERRAPAGLVEEHQHVVKEEHGNRNDPEVEKPLPAERRAGGAGGAQAEDAEVPDREPGSQPREDAVAVASAVGRERAAEQEQVQGQRDEREEPMYQHRAARDSSAEMRPARAALASRARGSRTPARPSAGRRSRAPRGVRLRA